ncbi:MAG: glycosyltransferase family 2 protein [Thermoguttaceae bacterium]|jgi:glycosyltransferase involved in cell wall biosynthesis
MTYMVGGIDVLLATYNGESYLDEQLRSVLEQVGPGDRLLVRDDRSSDGTPGLLAEYAARYPHTLVLIDDRAGHLGAGASFATLLDHAEAPYVMFCDQDDVWLPGKMARTAARMDETQQRCGGGPVLVHTDLVVVDRSLRPLADSFWRYQHLDPVRGRAFNRLLVQNIATGCTIMINRALLERAAPLPRQSVLHDWWLALVAAAFGCLEFLPEATVLYRQHADNRVGARRSNPLALVGRAFDRHRWSEYARRLRMSQTQAAAFVKRFGDQLRPEHRGAVQAYAEIRKHGFLQRRQLLLRHGLCKPGWLRNLGLFARI